MGFLKAGAAIVDITPPVGGLMDGYGARTQPSQGVHDPLFARVLVLDDGQSQAAIVGCDLLGVHPHWVAWLRHEAHQSLGLPPEQVMVAATHNHAGPFGLRGGMFSRLDEELAQVTARKIIGALAIAQRQRREATLKVGSAQVDSVSMNRRHPHWPIDPQLRLLLVDGADGPIAMVLNFACHATVLDASNLLLSAEYPGVACRLLQENTGAPALFLNGACANVNPLWIKQDFANVERVGSIVGGEAIRLVHELRTLGRGQRAHNIRWDEFPQKPVAGALIDLPRLRAARRELELPLRQFLSDEEYATRIGELEEQRERASDSEERRRIMEQFTRLQSERWAGAWARRRQLSAQRTEVQALSLGEGLAVLALPGEFFVETAQAMERAAAMEHLLISCYTNDYIGYVCPPEAYEQGGYEAGVTFCTPDAEPLLVQTAVELLKSISP